MHRADDYLRIRGIDTLNRAANESAYSSGVIRSLNVARKPTANAEAKERPEKNQQ